MLDEDHQKTFRNFETFYDTVKGYSPIEKAQMNVNEIYTTHLSEPLKKLHAEYLNSVIKKCYPERHLSEDFPNLQQINLCRDLERQRVLGKFFSASDAIRDSSLFKFQDCVHEANQSIESGLNCIHQYVNDTKEDNQKIIEAFRRDYPKFF